jgi:hypothetical protein
LLLVEVYGLLHLLPSAPLLFPLLLEQASGFFGLVGGGELLLTDSVGTLRGLLLQIGNAVGFGLGTYRGQPFLLYSQYTYMHAYTDTER